MKEQYRVIKNILLNHGVIAFPTETVMGLGIKYDDFDAYNRLNIIKRRSPDKPYTMMLGEVDDIGLYCKLNDRIIEVIKRFLPGSLTILLNAKECVPGFVTHNSGVIGIRIPSNLEALELLHYLKFPLLVPSANRSNEKPALNSDEVKNIFGDEIDYIVEGASSSGRPTTIVDLTGDNAKIIREGDIPLSEINDVLNKKR